MKFSTWVAGTYNYKSFDWLQIILAVGTKLQAILAKMAIEITERHAVVQGMPLVQGSDKYFWFGQPQLVLHLIHFALFQVFNGFPFSIRNYLKTFLLKKTTFSHRDSQNLF